MTSALADKVVVVTGAGRGLGQAIALQLGAAGARIGLVARSGDELVQTAEMIVGAGGVAVPIPVDLADRSAAARIVARTQDELGKVDILLNNAGVIWPLAASIAVDMDEWASALAINLTAVAALSFAVLPDMLASGWGRIVNVSSGVVAQPQNMIGANAYVTAKAGLEGHTSSLAAELDGTGVTVNAYRPGALDTSMQVWMRSQDPARVGSSFHERYNRLHDEGLLITPAESAYSLVSRLTSAATGQVWSVRDEQ